MMDMKVFPNDYDLEVYILGGILLDARSITRHIPSLSPEKFYDRRNQIIMESIQKLYRENKEIDILSITRDIRGKNLMDEIGGAMYISSLSNKVASTARMEEWILMLTEYHIRREFISRSASIYEDSFDLSKDIFEIYDSFMNHMSTIISENIKNEVNHISSLTKSTIDSIKHRADSESGMSGYSSGIRSVDKKLGGHQKSDLMYMAGRPAMGKTAMALTEVLNLAEQGIPVAFFSLEMSSDQIVYRLASMISKVPAEILMKYKLDPYQSTSYYVAIDKLHTLPIYIDDTASLSVYDLRSKVKRMKEKYGIRVCFVDYIQLMNLGSFSKKNTMNREQELSTISRNLKLIAKECDIPMIVLSQLSRAVESRSDKRPLLSDLRESGSLEQDADIVTFLFRPEYYGITQDDQGNSTHGLGEFIVAKQRNGSTGICEMRFIPEIMRYTDINTF